MVRCVIFALVIGFMFDRAFLSTNVDANKSNISGNTPLHSAVLNLVNSDEHVQVINLLVETGANPGPWGSSNFTSLQPAVCNGWHLEIMKLAVGDKGIRGQAHTFGSQIRPNNFRKFKGHYITWFPNSSFFVLTTWDVMEDEALEGPGGHASTQEHRVKELDIEESCPPVEYYLCTQGIPIYHTYLHPFKRHNYGVSMDLPLSTGLGHRQSPPSMKAP